ncbi:MAG: hypothetical protein ABFS46_16220 [Myxococcota bacterium]
MGKKSAPRLLALTAMLLTLGFAGVEENVVLCIGGDGHLAIEASGPEGCSDGPQAASAATAIAIPSSSSHCGPCVDVALTASSATECVAAAKRSGPTPAVIPIAVLALAAPRRRAPISHRSSIQFISQKPHTVVIRC